MCAPEYVDDFDREIAEKEDELSLRLSNDRGPGHIFRVAVLKLRSAAKCLRENGLKYTLRRIFTGRRR